MLVTGLLLTLSTDSQLAASARQQLVECAEVMLGAAADRWLPLAVATPDVGAAHDFHEWLETLPGVELVDVTYVGFDESSLTENGHEPDRTPHLSQDLRPGSRKHRGGPTRQRPGASPGAGW